MSFNKKFSRREFVRLAGLTATGAWLAACGASSPPVEQPAEGDTAAQAEQTPTSAPPRLNR